MAELYAIDADLQVDEDMANYVIRRSLSQNDLRGAIPLAWTSNNTFAALTTLYLNDNNLAGRIPNATTPFLFRRYYLLDTGRSAYS